MGVASSQSGCWTPSAPLRPGVNRGWWDVGVGPRRKEEGAWVLRHLTPSSQSRQATRLPENSPWPSLPSSAPPVALNKRSGAGRGKRGVYFLVSMVLGELHQVWSVGGCWDELPGATAPLALLGIFNRRTSFSVARFRQFPSSLTFHGPSRSRTLVTSLGPQTPGPSAPGPFSGSPMVLHVSSLVIPTPWGSRSRLCSLSLHNSAQRGREVGIEWPTLTHEPPPRRLPFLPKGLALSLRSREES